MCNKIDICMDFMIKWFQCVVNIQTESHTQIAKCQNREVSIMYTGKNPSALRSRAEIVQAFLGLIHTTTFEKLQIKQLMDATGLTRQTFYQIFKNKEEILEYYLDTLFAEFVSHAEKREITTLCDAAEFFFAFFSEYREPLGVILRNGKSCVVQRKCREYLYNSHYLHYALKGADTPEQVEYATTFLVSGMVAMLEQWLRTGSQVPSGELARLICRITGSLEK